jgi:peptide/nickel transport system substrate-binding protein
MSKRVFQTEEFDIYPMGWGGWNAFGLSIEAIFHSDNAGNDSQTTAYNSMNYGNSGGSADKLIDAAYNEFKAEKRNKKWAKALERIYLDMPYMVMDYAKYRWPMNTKKFGGYIEGIVDPGYATWTDQLNNLYLKENVKQ